MNMVQNITPTPLVTSLGEAKAWLRMTTTDDDAVLAGLCRVAEEACADFIGQILLAREVKEVVAIGTGWTPLSARPARAILSVTGLHADGEAFALPVGAYEIDIDARGVGKVRATGFGSGINRVEVSYRAGLAADWNHVPEPLRMGIVRLATELYRERDRDDARDIPPAIAALWQPWRVMRLG